MMRGAASMVLLMLAASASADPQTNGADDMLASLPTVPAVRPAPSAPPVASLPSLVRMGPMSFAPLVRKVASTVVNIAVIQDVDDGTPRAHVKVPQALRGTPFERQFKERMRRRREQMLGAGSGFVINPSGVIVTNNHVVAGAEKITVSFADGSALPARVLGSDTLTDIAVIKVTPKHPLPYATWGDSRRLDVGDWVLAAGNPFGLGSSVTAGIVSARSRDIGAGPFDDFLQLDAPINPGNSGGPSFNMSGQVVALNTAIVSPTGGSVGIGFGIPSEIVAPIVAALRAKGHVDRGWLGVTLEDQPDGDPALASDAIPESGPEPGLKSGLESGPEFTPEPAIVSIDRASPAMRAGLKPGDAITSINGDKIDNARSLVRAIAAATPGSKILLSIIRRSKAMNVPVVVGHRPAESDG